MLRDYDMSLKERDWMQDGESEAASETPLMTPLEGAITMHEMFLSYVEAGFTEMQAMQLLIAILQKPT